jgi:hypothetical protein
MAEPRPDAPALKPRQLRLGTHLRPKGYSRAQVCAGSQRFTALERWCCADQTIANNVRVRDPTRHHHHRGLCDDVVCRCVFVCVRAEACTPLRRPSPTCDRAARVALNLRYRYVVEKSHQYIQQRNVRRLLSCTTTRPLYGLALSLLACVRACVRSQRPWTRILVPDGLTTRVFITATIHTATSTAGSPAIILRISQSLGKTKSGLGRNSSLTKV